MTDHDAHDPELEEWLSALPKEQPSASLRRAVAEIPLRHPQSGGALLPWPLRSLWQGLLSAALVASLGIAVGLLTAEPNQPEEEWSELRELALAPELEWAPDEEAQGEAQEALP